MWSAYGTPAKDKKKLVAPGHHGSIWAKLVNLITPVYCLTAKAVTHRPTDNHLQSCCDW